MHGFRHEETEPQHYETPQARDLLLAINAVIVFKAYTVTTTTCFKSGDYSPSAYAGNIGASGEVSAYLKSAGL